MIKLNFPDLQFIKNHERHPNPKDKDEFEEYEWIIFDIDDSPAYCRITYNEDDNGMLYLDMMCNGYCDQWVPDGFNKTYPTTAKGYKELQKVANREVNKIISSMIASNKEFSEDWADT